MPAVGPELRDVFNVREVARAAGVPADSVRTLLRSAQVATVDGRFLAATEAVRAVRMLRGLSQDVDGNRSLFRQPLAESRKTGMPLAISGALHAGAIAMLAFVTTLGLRGDLTEVRAAPSPVRLVFLTTPGPGGGGGGGGLRQPKPPAPAALKGKAALRSPVSVRRPEKKTEQVRPTPPPAPPVAVEQPAEPPPPVAQAAPIPPVVAPVVSVPAEEHDRAGVVADSGPTTDSRGSGGGGGTGSGQGTGAGEGDGSGIGAGSGGGTGGGPYRSGSGVTPPRLLREIKPEYTEEARRRGLEGDVVLEIVVRSDGSVGSVTLSSGLGGGLNQRAVDAVRQWRFSPARRLGAPVDVMVEVAVEFRLR